VKKIRALLANYPMMIPDAVRVLMAKQEGVEIVGEVRGPMKVLQETGRVCADTVVMITEEDIVVPALCSQLLAVYPDLTIIMITTEGDRASTLQLRSHRKNFYVQELGDAVNTIRAAMKEVCVEKW